MSPQVLSREENRERTRSSLLASAAKVFARRGYDRATLDEVAADAGYTKGAVYANFKGKEELFLAMLDERFAARLEELDRVLSSDEPPEEQARRAGGDFARYVTADPDWQRLRSCSSPTSPTSSSARCWRSSSPACAPSPRSATASRPGSGAASGPRAAAPRSAGRARSSP